MIWRRIAVLVLVLLAATAVTLATYVILTGLTT